MAPYIGHFTLSFLQSFGQDKWFIEFFSQYKVPGRLYPRPLKVPTYQLFLLSYAFCSSSWTSFSYIFFWISSLAASRLPIVCVFPDPCCLSCWILRSMSNICFDDESNSLLNCAWKIWSKWKWLICGNILSFLSDFRLDQFKCFNLWNDTFQWPVTPIVSGSN